MQSKLELKAEIILDWKKLNIINVVIKKFGKKFLDPRMSKNLKLALIRYNEKIRINGKASLMILFPYAYEIGKSSIINSILKYRRILFPMHPIVNS